MIIDNLLPATTRAPNIAPHRRNFFIKCTIRSFTTWKMVKTIRLKEFITSTVRRTSMLTTSGSCLGSLVSMWIKLPSSTSTVFTTCPKPTMASVSFIRMVSFTYQIIREHQQELFEGTLEFAASSWRDSRRKISSSLAASSSCSSSNVEFSFKMFFRDSLLTMLSNLASPTRLLVLPW